MPSWQYHLNLVLRALVRGAPFSHGSMEAVGDLTILELSFGVGDEQLGRVLPVDEGVLPGLQAAGRALLYLAQQRHDTLLKCGAT